MGSETVIFMLAAALVLVIIQWRYDVRLANEAKKSSLDLVSRLDSQLTEDIAHIAELESEIQRLRKIPLTEKPKDVDSTLIKAKSAAQVRQLTEAAWGKQPETGEANDDR